MKQILIIDDEKPIRKVLRQLLEKHGFEIQEAENGKTAIKIFKNPKKDIGISDIDDITPVVERDGGYVWIMEKEKVLDKFPLKNVHGGIKYQFPKAENIFVPTRDGIVAKYSLKNGRVEGEFRACINLRNVSLSRDGRYGFATWLSRLFQ